MLRNPVPVRKLLLYPRNIKMFPTLCPPRLTYCRFLELSDNDHVVCFFFARDDIEDVKSEQKYFLCFVGIGIRPSAIPCSEAQFQCANFLCIHATLKCDGDDDCGDGSDEINGKFYFYDVVTSRRHTAWRHTTSHYTMLCNVLCIHATLKCDGDDDCGDGSDEINGEF